MRFAVSLAGVLSAALLALLAAMPWSTNDVGRLVLPMLPILAIVFWSIARPLPLPVTGVFLAGLFTDAVVQAPVGFWTLIALLTALFVRVAARGSLSTSTAGRAMIVTLAVFLTVANAWSLSYFYTMSPSAIEPYAMAAALALLAYIPISAVLGAVNRLVSHDGPIHSLTGLESR